MASAPGERCVRCGQAYGPAQMEITADGYRCFRCSQAAAIDQHNANIAAQVLLSFGIALGIAIVLTIPAVLLMRRRPPAA